MHHVFCGELFSTFDPFICILSVLNILYFCKPRITRKFNGNFNGIPLIPVINGINGNNPEIPKRNVNLGQNPGNSGQST